MHFGSRSFTFQSGEQLKEAKGTSRSLPTASSSGPSFLSPVSAHLLEVSKLKPEMEAFRPLGKLFYLAELVGDGPPGKARETWPCAAWEMELHHVLSGP